MRIRISDQHQYACSVAGGRLYSSERYRYYVLLHDGIRWSNLHPNGKLVYAKGHGLRRNEDQQRGGGQRCTQPGIIVSTIVPPILEVVSVKYGCNVGVPSYQQHGPIGRCRDPGFSCGRSRPRVGRVWGVQGCVEDRVETASEGDEGLIPQALQGGGGPWGGTICLRRINWTCPIFLDLDSVWRRQRLDAPVLRKMPRRQGSSSGPRGGVESELIVEGELKLYRLESLLLVSFLVFSSSK